MATTLASIATRLDDVNDRLRELSLSYVQIASLANDAKISAEATRAELSTYIKACDKAEIVAQKEHSAMWDELRQHRGVLVDHGEKHAHMKGTVAGISFIVSTLISIIAIVLKLVV